MRNFSARFSASVAFAAVAVAWVTANGQSSIAEARRFRSGREFLQFRETLNCPEAENIVYYLKTETRTPDTELRESFEKYFNDRLFPQFVQFDNRPEWKQVRDMVKRRFFLPAQDEMAYKLLNEVMFAKLKQYATGDYQIETRCHAMLFIGETLNKTLPIERGVVPLPEALTFLAEAAGDEKLPDAVRIASFVGIRRHLKAHPSEETKKMVADAMLTIVNGQAAKDNKEDAVRIEAAHVAAELGKDTPEVKALLTFPVNAVDTQPRASDRPR